MRLVDVHCHLEDPVFDDRLDDIITDARRAGIVRLITASVVPSDFAKSRSIAARYPEVSFALGIHPWYVTETSERDADSLAAARDLGAVAIGEIGLDRKIDAPDFELQRRIFEKQLAIANELSLPVVLHCRGAFSELVESLKRVGRPAGGGIIHAFSGSVEIAERCIAMNLSFSMGGTLTYRNSRKRETVVRRIYPDHFMLETDSPDIPPVECREKPNVPSNILYNLAAAAETLGRSREEVALRTTQTAERIFGLPPS